MTKFKIYYDGKNCFVNGRKAKKKSNWTRRTYSYKNYIVKIEDKRDCELYHIRQCKHEYELYNKLEKRDKKYFIQILQYGHTKDYDFVVQPLVKFRSGRPSQQIKNSVWKIVEKYNLVDFIKELVCNWAITKDGNFIIYDYGL